MQDQCNPAAFYQSEASWKLVDLDGNGLDLNNFNLSKIGRIIDLSAI